MDHTETDFSVIISANMEPCGAFSDNFGFSVFFDEMSTFRLEPDPSPTIFIPFFFLNHLHKSCRCLPDGLGCITPGPQLQWLKNNFPHFPPSHLPRHTARTAATRTLRYQSDPIPSQTRINTSARETCALDLAQDDSPKKSFICSRPRAQPDH